MKVSAVTHKYDSNASGNSGIVAHTHKWSAYKSDKSGHWRVCTDKTCGQKEATASHNYGEWLTDVSGHYRSCKICGEDSPIEKHVSAAPATQTKDEVCAVCDYIITPALSHVHKPTKVEAKPATCAQDGTVEHYRCTCGKRFADAAGKTEITRHTDIIKRATGKHTDENNDGQCDVCGKAVDSAVPESSEPVDSPADMSDIKQQTADKMRALPFIILGACAAVAAAAVTGILIWSKKKTPLTK
jgi:transcription elongation factor Elf1